MLPGKEREKGTPQERRRGSVTILMRGRGGREKREGIKA